MRHQPTNRPNCDARHRQAEDFLSGLANEKRRGCLRLPRSRGRQQERTQMRNMMAVALAATVMFPGTPESAPQVEAGNQSQTEVQRAKPGSKQWCRNHKKKCKRQAKKRRQTTQHFISEATHPPDFWNESGHVVGPGDTNRRGCGKILMDRASASSPVWPHTVFYTQRLSAEWCWHKRGRRIKNVRILKGHLDPHWSQDLKRNRFTRKDWYQWRDGWPRSGRAIWLEAHLRTCLVAGIGCIRSDYPYTRLYIHSNGTYYSSGHAW